MIRVVYSFRMISIFFWFSEFYIKFAHQDVIEPVLHWSYTDYSFKPGEREAFRGRDRFWKSPNWDSINPKELDVFYARNNMRYIYITTPIVERNLPISFGFLLKTNRSRDQLIVPFPNWKWHNRDWQKIPYRPCNTRLLSVHSIKIDKCGYLHVLDSGNEGNGTDCPPKLLMFNLNYYPWTIDIHYNYEFPPNVYTRNSVFTDLQIHNNLVTCDAEVHAFAADTNDSSLVHACPFPPGRLPARIFKVSSMKPLRAFSKFSILGDNFTAYMGIYAAALSPPLNVLDTNLTYLFMPLSSRYLSYISLQDLFKDDAIKRFKTFKSPLPSQSSALAISRLGIVFIANLEDTSIACAPLGTPDLAENLYTVYRNTSTLQFISTLKIIEAQGGREQLWVLANKYQLKIAKKMISHELPKFIISVGWVDEILKDTPCLEFAKKLRN